MGDLFRGKQVAENVILVKEEVLMPEYAPTEIIHREGEIKAIAEATKPLLDKKTPNNLFIYGNSGTGKTTSVKHVLGELKEASSKTVPVYINCWEYKTQTAIYIQILQGIGGTMPRRGLATDEIFNEIKSRMKKESLGTLLVLDELDALLFSKEQEVLYNISRSGAHFGIMGISCDAHLLGRLDPKITSSLRFTELEFRPYSSEQVVEILKERARLALAKGTWSFEILERCAGIGKANGGNVRLALEMLWKAAQLAEKKNAAKIELCDVAEASKKTFYKKVPGGSPFTHSFDIIEMNLNSEEKEIISILAKKEITTPDLYLEFGKKFQRTKRQVRNYLSSLEAKGLIEMLEAKDAGMEHSMLKPKVVRLKPKA